MKFLTTSLSSRSVNANFFLDGVLHDGFSSDFAGDPLFGFSHTFCSCFGATSATSVAPPLTELAEPFTNASLEGPFLRDSSFELFTDSVTSIRKRVYKIGNFV